MTTWFLLRAVLQLDPPTLNIYLQAMKLNNGVLQYYNLILNISNFWAVSVRCLWVTSGTSITGSLTSCERHTQNHSADAQNHSADAQWLPYTKYTINQGCWGGCRLNILLTAIVKWWGCWDVKWLRPIGRIKYPLRTQSFPFYDSSLRRLAPSLWFTYIVL